MALFFLIGGLAAALFGLRLAGLSLGERSLPPQLQALLSFAPVAVLAALTAPAFGDAAGIGAQQAAPLQAAALILTGVITWWSKRPGLGILVGLGLVAVQALL